MTSRRIQREEFVKACQDGNFKVVKEIVDKLKNWESADDESRFHELMGSGVNEASRHGHTDLVLFLLGIRPKLDINLGFCHAMSGGHLELVKLLIDRGASDFYSGWVCAGNQPKEIAWKLRFFLLSQTQCLVPDSRVKPFPVLEALEAGVPRKKLPDTDKTKQILIELDTRNSKTLFLLKELDLPGDLIQIVYLYFAI